MTMKFIQKAGLTIQTYIANLETDNENSIITLLKYKDFEMLFMVMPELKLSEKSARIFLET